MSQIITKKFNELPIRIILINSKEWFFAKDGAELLGYTNPQKAIRDHCKKPLSFNDLSKMNELSNLNLQPILGNSWKQIKIIQESDVLLLITKSQNKTEKEKQKIINFLNLKNKIILFSRKETEFIYNLREALRPFNIKIETQKKVKKYFIDIYISSKNIAIEFDENNHNNYS